MSGLQRSRTLHPQKILPFLPPIISDNTALCQIGLDSTHNLSSIYDKGRDTDVPGLLKGIWLG